MAGAPLLLGQVERAGVVHPGQGSRETSEHLSSTWRRAGEEISTGACSDMTKGNGFKMKVRSERNSLLWARWGTGTGYPEKLWISIPGSVRDQDGGGFAQPSHRWDEIGMIIPVSFQPKPFWGSAILWFSFMLCQIHFYLAPPPVFPSLRSGRGAAGGRWEGGPWVAGPRPPPAGRRRHCSPARPHPSPTTREGSEPGDLLPNRVESS